MFEPLKNRVADMRTIARLCRAAEAHANADGRQDPGAEHFVLAAIELPDGSARRAFERAGADPAAFAAAIARQYVAALRDVGLEPDTDHSPEQPVPPRSGVYRAAESGRALIGRLHELRAYSGAPRLVAAHVVLAATAARHGIVPRAIRELGIDPERLAAAARTEAAALGGA